MRKFWIIKPNYVKCTLSKDISEILLKCPFIHKVSISVISQSNKRGIQRQQAEEREGGQRRQERGRGYNDGKKEGWGYSDEEERGEEEEYNDEEEEEKEGGSDMRRRGKRHEKEQHGEEEEGGRIQR